ncbi:hypothetical protein ACFOPX_02590 [Helicobacter baculiformis]|uniref:Lipoprotein n=1 Tax=Helicobacter baculiformis TaxID=427351 RepID=A0ABV7ZJL9_9HELI|nr:hypothetical protein [Helicobacter baculiformis]
MRSWVVASCLALGLVTGCTKYSVVPENISKYNNGVQVLVSNQAHSKVQVEVAQKKIKGLDNPPLVFYVGAQLTGGDPVDFDSSHISVHEGQQNLPVLSFKQMLKSSYDFDPVLQKFNIAVPSTPITADNLASPMFYYGQGSFLAYDLMLGTPFMMMDDAQTQAIMQDERQAFKIMAINYLRRSTLKPDGKARGGFVVVDPKHITAGTLVVKVALNNEVHTFKIDIK